MSLLSIFKKLQTNNILQFSIRKFIQFFTFEDKSASILYKLNYNELSKYKRDK